MWRSTLWPPIMTTLGSSAPTPSVTSGQNVRNYRSDCLPARRIQNVHDIVHEAIENARYVCEEHYGMFKGPPVQLICPKDLHFAYVQGHLSHICFELLKNSLRAVV